MEEPPLMLGLLRRAFIMHFESIIWKFEFNSKMGKVVKINEAEREGNVCNTLTAFDNKLIIKN